jgi:glycerophosphoryl diester phosphodiesterase
VVVVSHDVALNPAITRDARAWIGGPGPLVRSLTLQQLQAYDVGRVRPDSAYGRGFPQQQPRDGTRIPTLAACSPWSPAKGAPVRFNIETKIDANRPDDTVSPEAMATALLKTMRRPAWRPREHPELRLAHAAPREGQGARDPDGLPHRAHGLRRQRADPRWTAGLRLAEHGNSVPRLAKAAGCATWSPNAAALTPELLKEAQDAGLKVVPWTVNEPADMDRLIGWGVDGLITDYPDRAREVMKAGGWSCRPRFRGR